MHENYMAVSREDTYRLIEQAQKGDEEAKSLLVSSNSGLVMKLAHKFSLPETDYEDFVQIGYLGLLKAIYRFDPGYNVMFSTYAVPIILGEMKQFFRDSGKIKAGRAIKSQIYNMRKIREQHLLRTGEEIRVAELAHAMETTVEHVVEIMSAENALTNVSSLDNPEGRPGNIECEKMPGDEISLDFMAVKLEIQKLPPRQRAVMGLRYFRDMTQTEVAGILGISQVQVSRTEKKALETIRSSFLEENKTLDI